MSRMVGTVSRGVRAPIIRSGDDLVEIVTKSVLEAAAQPEDGFAIRYPVSLSCLKCCLF